MKSLLSIFYPFVLITLAVWLTEMVNGRITKEKPLTQFAVISESLKQFFYVGATTTLFYLFGSQTHVTYRESCIFSVFLPKPFLYHTTITVTFDTLSPLWSQIQHVPTSLLMIISFSSFDNKQIHRSQMKWLDRKQTTRELLENKRKALFFAYY